jgi:methionyl-tRNA formyltransferase
MAMARIARDHRLAAIVGPPPAGGIRQKLRRILGRSRHPLAGFGVPLIDAGEVGRFNPDVIVVASFPRIIPAAVLASAGIGALNMHMSPLPRHRGVDPVFWTYWDDDAAAGVTIHWMDRRVDAGDVAAQESLPLPRGLPSRDLYMKLADVGVTLLAGVLARLAAGERPRKPQDEGRASYQSAADIAGARIPFAQWPAERVWHVLSGLGDQRSGLVADAAGRPLSHGRALRFHAGSDVKPGHIETVNAGYELHCSDGIVSLERRP